MANWNWLLAIVCNVFGSFVCAWGWMLQKKTHNSEQAKLHQEPDTNNIQDLKNKNSDTDTPDSNETTLSYIRNWRWWAGYITYGVGSSFASIAYALAPQSLILPLESLTIVFNALFGAKCLNEHLYKKDWIGIVLIIIGSISVVLVGPKGSEDGIEYTTDDLEKLFRNAEFLIFISIYSLLIFIHYLTVHFQLYALDTYYMVGFTNVSAYFGSWCGLCVTCGMLIFASSVQSKEIAKANFTHWLTYVIGIIWVVTVLCLEYWRQKSLALYISTYVSAIYRSMIVVGGILFGAIFFKDFQYSSDREIVIFCLGVVVILVGVAIIAVKVDENDKLEHRKSIAVVSKKESKKCEYQKAASTDFDDCEQNENVLTQTGVNV